MPRLHIVVFAAASLASLSGCIEGISPARERTAFISAIAYSTGGGTALAMRPLGAFYRADGLTVGLPPINTCIGLPYSTTPPNLAFLPTIDAGPGLYTTLSGRQDTLFRNNTSGLETYQMRSNASIPYTAGDTLHVEIPGEEDGFPALNIQVRTAEPFDYLTPADPTDGADMTVNWTAAPSSGSVMTFAFRFSNTSVSEEPDTQIYCAFTDNGTGIVPAGYAASWVTSSEASRSIRASRVRYVTTEIDARTKVTLLSYFDRPLRELSEVIE